MRKLNCSGKPAPHKCTTTHHNWWLPLCNFSVPHILRNIYSIPEAKNKIKMQFITASPIWMPIKPLAWQSPSPSPAYVKAARQLRRHLSAHSIIRRPQSTRTRMNEYKVEVYTIEEEIYTQRPVRMCVYSDDYTNMLPVHQASHSDGDFCLTYIQERKTKRTLRSSKREKTCYAESRRHAPRWMLSVI